MRATEEPPLVILKDVANSVFERTGTQTSRVTVIVTLFNYSKYIVECLDSVAAQTLEALDLAVIDDCSTDNSVAIARAWCEQHADRFNRCQLLQHKKNRGLPHARNAAFTAARAPSVFVLDADNIIYPRCIEAHALALDNCDASFAYSYREIFGARSNVENLEPWDGDRLPYGNKVDAMVMLRRDCWREAGGYSVDMPVTGWEDFDLWFKINENKGYGILVPEILTRYRVHNSSMLHTTTNSKTHEIWGYLRRRYGKKPGELWPLY